MTTKPSSTTTTSRRRKAMVKVETTPVSVDPAPGPSPPSSAHPQYPQLQFVHVPYSYPYIVPAPPPPPQGQAHLSVHPLPQTPVQPQQAVSTPSQPQAPSLETIFQDTVHKFRDLEMTLATVQAATKRAIVRQQHEQNKLRAHCMTFKQERDVARRQVMLLLQERSQLLTQRRHSAPPLYAADSSSPPPPATAHLGNDLESPVEKQELSSSPTTEDSSEQQRRAARNSRKHSPYSPGPIRRSSSPTNQAFPSSPTSLHPARPSSTPPTFPRPAPSSSASTVCTPIVEEDLQFVIFDPLRKAGDSTSFEVSYNEGPESIIFERTRPSRARQVQVRDARPQIRLRQDPAVWVDFPAPPPDDGDGEVDMDLGSDDEEEEGMRTPVPRTSGMDSMEDVRPAEPSIAIQHLDLLYTPAQESTLILFI
ncbi:hypothetical protein MD484_g4426, partial [Candolleomyces efflorescens]